MENIQPIRNGSDTLRSTLWLALAFAAIKMILQVGANLWQAHLGWGYFLDETYYILCGQNLDWSYVDHGPIVALQARLAVLLFGKSLAGIRMFSALAGAAQVFLTGVIAWKLGAGGSGQAIAMGAVLLTPEFLGIDSFLSMNSFESAFWMTTVVVVMLLLDGGAAWWWVVLGVAAGIGCDNKPSMLFFLIALVLGLLVTPQRRVLFSRGVAVASVIAVLLVLPVVLWQYKHDWAMVHFLKNARMYRHHRYPSVLKALAVQVLVMSPFSFPLWAAGLWWLLLGKGGQRFRFLGWTFVFFILLMLILREDGKEYYVTPVYPFLFAAGGVVCEMVAGARRYKWIVPAYAVLLYATDLVMLPLALPVLRPQQWMTYTAWTHTRAVAGQRNEKLSGFYLMRFGWQELADDVTRVYQSLPPEEKAKAGIFTTTYGEASAINFLGAGRGLPFATSGHNNYFIWGPHGETGAVMIVVSFRTKEEMLRDYASVEQVGVMHPPYVSRVLSNIYLCRGYKGNFVRDWPKFKHYE